MITTQIDDRNRNHNRNHNRRLIKVNRRSRKLAAPQYHILIPDSVPSEGREIFLSPITPLCNSVMKYMVPSLLGLVTFKYQSKPENLFVENLAPIWCFLVANCVYWIIVGGLKQMQAVVNTKYLRILSRVASVIGVLSALSLVSVLLPHWISFVPFIIWITNLPLVVAWPMLYGAYTWLRSRITTHVDKIRAKMVYRETSLPV